MTPADFLVIAHRGASGEEPENTLRALARAVELGADGVEVDLHVSADGVPVLIHDRSLRRTTGVRGWVDALPLHALQQLDAGKGERIPTLREALALLAGKVRLFNLELKGRGSLLPVWRELEQALASGAWQPEQFLLSSFHRPTLKEATRLPLHLPLGFLIARGPMWLKKALQTFAPFSIHLPARMASRRRLAAIRRTGRPVFVYTVNTPSAIARMQQLGANGIFTDFPDRVPRDFPLVGGTESA